MYLAHRKLSNGYNPLFAKHPATDPLIECTCYIWERDCIFSHYHDKKKRHEHLSSPFLVLRLPIRNSSLVFIQSSPFLVLRLPIQNSSLVFNLSTKRNKSTITNLLNFITSRKKETKRRTEERDGDTWRTCPPDKICPIQADRRFSQRASITCTPNSSTCW